MDTRYKMLFLILFALGNFDAVTGWLCPADEVVQSIYVPSRQQAVIGFQTTLISSSNRIVRYRIVAFNNTNIYIAMFYNEVLQSQKSYLGSVFIGDASRGNFTVKTRGVHPQDGGVYQLQYKLAAANWYTERCSIVFVLDKPQKATVSHDNNNVLGRNSTLSCDSSSITYPTNHTLRLIYNWKVNDITNYSNSRYKYGTSDKTLTIMFVSKEDANKRFECSATESGDGVTGLTSDYSDEFLFTVIYGPGPSTTTLAPTNTEYTLNEDVPLNNITCIGDCYPRCNFKWTKPGTNGASIVSNNAVLSLGTLSRTEASTYTCEVTNANATVRTERMQVVVHVNYGPDDSTTKLTPSSTTYTRNEGDSLNDIQCSGNCYPSCDYKWTKSGGSTAVNRATLSLGSLDRTEAGTYTCTVNNPTTSSKQTKTVSIFVRYGPDTSSTTLAPANTTYTLVENTRLGDIVCAADCYHECNYKWTKPDNTVVSNKGVLSLGTLKRNEATTYTCTVTRSQTSVCVTKQVSVIVIYGPDTCNINSSSPLTLTEGRSSPTVSCESECYPSCSRTWSKVSSNSPIGENGKFQLVKATRYQAGNYKCFCKNTATAQYVKNQTASLHIIIQYPPDVNVSLSTENITEGKTLILSCDADGVPTVYTYNGLTQTWYGSPVPNTHREVSGTPRQSSLHIQSLQLQDSGTYTCYVNNGVKTADTVSSVTVKVKVLPKILSPLLQFAGKTDGTVNVSVQFYSYPDIEEVVFKQHDDQTITNDTDRYIVSHFETTVDDKFYGKDVSLSGMQANLVISNLKQEDFGSYTLILKNELGKTITPFTVDAESFRYLSKAGTHAFTWFGGFNGGKLQTFIIQTSTADQENWQNRTTVTEEMDSQNVVTYWANISSLLPGTYSARLFAWNVYGKSDYVSLNSTFTISSTVRVDNTSFNAAALTGGLSSAVVVIITVAIVAVFIYRRKYWKKGGCSSSLKEGNNTEVQENSYYNLASSPTYEHLQTNEELSGWYASLEAGAVQGNSKEEITYENLKLTDSNLTK